MDCSPPGSSVHGISKARILEQLAILFSRGSPPCRDWTWESWSVFCTAGRFFNCWATWEALPGWCHQIFRSVQTIHYLDTSQNKSNKYFYNIFPCHFMIHLSPKCENWWRQKCGGAEVLFQNNKTICWLFLKSLSAAAAAAKLLQSCPTLCDPIDSSPPGFPDPWILQARTLEWVAISFSNAWRWKVKVKSLSRVRLFATPWTLAYQAPLSMGFSRQ